MASEIAVAKKSVPIKTHFTNPNEYIFISIWKARLLIIYYYIEIKMKMIEI